MPEQVLIEVVNVDRSFRRPLKTPGRLGPLKDLLRPEYAEISAVKGLTFSIHAGESVAYVGANGAGKSTTLKLLTGILPPTSGAITVAGATPHQNRRHIASKIGVVFGQRTQLWWDLPVRDSFELLADVYSVSPLAFSTTLPELVETLRIGDLLSVPARQLSLGQRMRCDLAAALLHRPEVLFLDEPTIGLDISVREKFRRMLRDLNGLGTTIVLTSHDMADISQVCDRIIMLDKGAIVFDGAIAELSNAFGWRMTADFHLTEDLDPSSARQLLSIAGVLGVECSDARIIVSFDVRRCPVPRLVAFVAEKTPFTGLELSGETMESIVRQLFDGDLEIS